MGGSRVPAAWFTYTAAFVAPFVVCLARGPALWQALLVAAVPPVSIAAGRYVLARAARRPGEPVAGLVPRRSPRRMLGAAVVAAREPGRSSAGVHGTGPLPPSPDGAVLALEPGAPHPAPVPSPEPGAPRPAPHPLAPTGPAPAARTGRTAETALVELALDQWDDAYWAGGPPVPCVVLIHGEPGSGRTTLARELARNLPWRDGDGEVLSVRLHGGVSARDALLHLLNRLGAPRQTLLFQPEEGGRAELERLRAAYEDVLSERRVALLLDDAVSDEQVLPLIPERSRALVLVTGGEVLPGLRDRFGATLVGLGPLDDDTGLTLLPHRAAEPHTTRLLRAARGLPLTLRIAASIPPGSVPDVPEAPAGGSAEIMSAAFDALPEEARRVLRTLPLAGEASFGALAASVLGDLSEPVAGQVLAVLADAGFLEPAHEDRYRLHPVIREFAARRLSAEAPPEESAALERRLVRAYADLAELAIRQVDGRSSGPGPEPGPAAGEEPGPGPVADPGPDDGGAFPGPYPAGHEDMPPPGRATAVPPPGPPGPPGHPPYDGRAYDGPAYDRPPGGRVRRPFVSADAAVRWFEAERSFVTATLRRAGHAEPGDVQRLLVALCEFCVLRGDLYRLSRVNQLARALGRATMVNSALFHNAVAARQVGALARAQTDLEAMVDTQREASDPDGEARALRNLGITYHHEGRLTSAEAVLRKAVSHQGPAHLRYYRAWSLHALAAVVRDRGRPEEAAGLLAEALDLHREADSPHGQAWALLHWGQVHLLLGETDAAEGKLRRCRELYREVHDERGESWACTQLGRAMLLRGRPEEAAHALTQSLRWHQKNEDARGAAWTSYYIGLAHDAADDLRHAEDALAAAERQFAGLGDRFGLERCRADLLRAGSPRVRLRLLDDEVRVGSAVTVHVDLAVPRSHPWDSTPEEVVVVAMAPPGAEVEPYVHAYRTGGTGSQPAAFAFTARRAGSHELNFRIYHEEYGVLLQEVVTTVDVHRDHAGEPAPAAVPRRS